MVVLAKPRKALTSSLLSWRRVESYVHESFSVQKRKESAALLKSRASKKFRIIYHEAQTIWIIAVCDDPSEVWNDWCFVVKQPKLQQYDATFTSPRCDGKDVPCPVSPSLVTTHKFVKLQVRERTWCNFCKAFIFHLSAKECIYCKFIVHERCEEAVDNHPPMKYCKVAQDFSMQTISYEARLCVRGKDNLKAIVDKETLFELHPQRRVLLIRTAGSISNEYKIQNLQVRKSQKNRAKFRLRYSADGENVDLCRGGIFEMISAAECENFCSTLELLDPDRPQSVVGPNYEDCQLYIFTWNMGEKPPDKASLRSALAVQGFDLIVVGVQECDYLPRGSARSAEADWFRTVEALLDGQYVRVAATSLRYIRLQIFVSRSSSHKITKVKQLTEATGIGGVVGNKGGVGISLHYAQTRICFIASHLAAHQDHLDSRRRDYCDIIGGLSSHLSTGKYLDVLHAFDYLFWFGDLNYRLDMERSEVMKCIQACNFGRLLVNDQLLREMESKTVFQGFCTSMPNFRPTYKFVPGTYPREYDDAKQRIPSYTDRILWRSHVEDGVKALDLRSFEEITTSDHCPVAQRFVVRAKRQFILGDDAFATRRALKFGALLAHNIGMGKYRVKFVSGNLDGKWQTASSKSGAWRPAQVPLMPCILGVMDFIQRQPLFLVLWDMNTNRCRAQGVIPLTQLSETEPLSFDVQLLHEGSLAGSITGHVSVETIGDDDLDTPVPALLLLGDMPRRADEDEADGQGSGSDADVAPVRPPFAAAPPPLHPATLHANRVSSDAEAAPSRSLVAVGPQPLHHSSLPPNRLRSRPPGDDGRGPFSPRDPQCSGNRASPLTYDWSTSDSLELCGIRGGSEGLWNGDAFTSPKHSGARHDRPSSLAVASTRSPPDPLARSSSSATATPVNRSPTPASAPAEHHERPDAFRSPEPQRGHPYRGTSHARSRSNSATEVRSPTTPTESDRAENVYRRVANAINKVSTRRKG